MRFDLAQPKVLVEKRHNSTVIMLKENKLNFHDCCFKQNKRKNTSIRSNLHWLLLHEKLHDDFVCAGWSIRIGALFLERQIDAYEPNSIYLYRIIVETELPDTHNLIKYNQNS